MTVKVLIMSGYGINCEKESAYAFERAGAQSEIVHINDLISGKKKMSDYDIMMFPGGFSYGDDTGSGNAFANKMKNNLWDDLKKFIDSKKLILGVCNGFQIMTHLGLFSLPSTKYGEKTHALESNNINRYECRWVYLKNKCINDGVNDGVNDGAECVFTKGISMTHIPVAHGEGRFCCDEETLDRFKNNNQIVFTYCDENSKDADEKYPINPNGAQADVAAVCDKTGRIMGMMPHPERAIFSVNDPNFPLKREIAGRKGESIPELSESNFKIFKNAVAYAKNNHKYEAN